MSDLTNQSVVLVMEHIDKLAAKLGIGAEEVFSWYVKQIWIDLYIQIAWVIVLSTLGIILYRIGRKCQAKEEKVTSDKKIEGEWENPDVLMTFAAVAEFIAIIVGLFCVFSGVPKLMNINYHAFNDLLSRFNGVL